MVMLASRHRPPSPFKRHGKWKRAAQALLPTFSSFLFKCQSHLISHISCHLSLSLFISSSTPYVSTFCITVPQLSHQSLQHLSRTQTSDKSTYSSSFTPHLLFRCSIPYPTSIFFLASRGYPSCILVLILSFRSQKDIECLVLGSWQ